MFVREGVALVICFDPFWLKSLLDSSNCHVSRSATVLMFRT